MNALLGQTVRLGNSVSSRRGNELSAARAPVAAPRARGAVQTQCSLKELRDRISSVKNTKKITDAMKLVAAAKVRRAQDAVVSGRPFSENLVKVRLHPQCGLGTRLLCGARLRGCWQAGAREASSALRAVSERVRGGPIADPPPCGHSGALRRQHSPSRGAYRRTTVRCSPSEEGCGCCGVW